MSSLTWHLTCCIYNAIASFHKETAEQNIDDDMHAHAYAIWLLTSATCMHQKTHSHLLSIKSDCTVGYHGRLADQRVFDQMMRTSTAAVLVSCKTNN